MEAVWRYRKTATFVCGPWRDAGDSLTPRIMDGRMAGDWIKMRVDLVDDPAVISIAIATGIDQDFVVGKLHRIWSWANKHSADGHCHGVTSDWIDQYVQQQGFSLAMQSAGWLVINKKGIEFPEFNIHNSKPAKQRAAATKRVRDHRERCNDFVTQKKRRKAHLPRPLRTLVFERDGNRCVYCGRGKGEVYPTESKTDGQLCLDHVIPESRGGATNQSNIVTCCNSCSRKKSDRTPDQCGFAWPVNVTGKRYGSVTREEKRREESNTPLPPFAECVPDRVRECVIAWLATKPKPYKPQALKALAARVEKRVLDHGEQAVVVAIERAMSQGYKGWDFDDWFATSKGLPKGPRLPTPEEDAAWTP